MQRERSLPIYLVSGLMITLAILTGGAVLVWCGLLRFLFAGWQGVALPLMLALIAWLAFAAARDAWSGLAQAPARAIAALVTVQAMVFFIQVYGRISGDEQGINGWTLLPHALVVLVIGLMYGLSSQFNSHLLEADEPFEPIEAPDSESDDDDMMYLGGA